MNKYIADLGYYLPALLDPNGSIAKDYDIDGFPSEVFVDAHGLVRRTQLGGLNADALWAAVQAISQTATYYTVTASAPGGHGQVTPATQEVAEGGTASIAITPDSGYQIDTISLDSNLQTVTDATGMTLTLTNVRADHRIVVTFGPSRPSTFLGWKGEYFANMTLSGSPSFTRDDWVIDFDWGSDSPGGGLGADGFSIRWTRTVYLASGEYTFHTLTDDGVRFYVDGNLIIDKWVDMAQEEHTATVDLAKGKHSLKMEYYENGGGARAKLWWEKTVVFADAASSPYRVAIEELAGAGIIGGFSDNTFRPDSEVTRQQFAKMIVLALGLPVSESDVCTFTDVTAGQNASDPLYPDNYIAVCAAHGITTGKTATTFAPYDKMTRAQLITMVARAANLGDPPGSYDPGFPDFSAVHHPWARKAAYAGLLDGLQGMGSSYDFSANATRGEVAQVLSNLRSSSRPAWPGPAELISPGDGSIFSIFPRTTTLMWHSVQGAVSYLVETQFLCPVDSYKDWKWAPWVSQTVSGTTYTFDFVGAQPGRWRVTPLDANGAQGTPSDWWGFDYTR